MIVKKRSIKTRSDSDVGHVLLNGNHLICNCVVRDWIYPRKFAFIHVNNGNVIIEPTDNDCGYKVSKFGSQVRITYFYAKKFLEIPESTRIYCEKMKDGRILCKVSEATNPCSTR